MKKLIVLLLPILICGCSPSSNTGQNSPDTEKPSLPSGKVTILGGSGNSPDDPVIIQANNSLVGVGAEYQWLRDKYPGHIRIEQKLLSYNGKPMDVVTIKTKEGEIKDIYFDISSFFGKF